MLLSCMSRKYLDKPETSELKDVLSEKPRQILSLNCKTDSTDSLLLVYSADAEAAGGWGVLATSS